MSDFNREQGGGLDAYRTQRIEAERETAADDLRARIRARNATAATPVGGVRDDSRRNGPSQGVGGDPGARGVADQRDLAGQQGREGDDDGATLAGTLGDIALGAVEAPGAVVAGALDATQNLLDLALIPAQWLEERFPLGSVLDPGTPMTPEQMRDSRLRVIQMEPEDTTTGNVVRNVAKFATGFLTASNSAGLVGQVVRAVPTRVGTAGAAGFVGDMMVSAADDKRLAELLQESDNPMFDNAVVNYLAGDENDTELESRFKLALEGLAIGTAIEPIFRTMKIVKRARQARKQRLAAELGADDIAQAARQAADASDQVRRGSMGEQPITADELAERLGNPRGPTVREQRVQSAVDRVEQTGDRALAVVGGRGVAGDADQQVFLNLSRINEPEDIQQTLSKLADIDETAVNAARGGERQSFAEMQKLADEMGLSAEEIITRRRGEPMSAAQALAARKMLTASGRRVRELATRATESQTPVDLYAFRKALATHYAIQTEVVAARTATARALASWRIGVDGDLERAEAIGLMLRGSHKSGTKGSIDMARAVATLDTDKGLNRFARHTGSVFERTTDAVREYWINGLLSSPKTHAVNVTSNALTALYQIPERWLAGHVSRAIFNGEVARGEAEHIAYGMVNGFRDGIRLAAKSLKTGEAQFRTSKIETAQRGRAISAERLNLTGAWGHAADALGTVIGAPTRLLQAEDDFFKAINYRAQIHAGALRQATSEGLEGDALARRVVDLTENPSEAIRLKAANFADVQTFTNELGAIGQTGMRFANQFPFARYVVPFIRTPTNIIKYTFARTPVAPLFGATRRAMREGSRIGATPEARADAAEAWARVGLSSTLMLAFGDMVRSGQVTGAGPSDRELQAARRGQGIPKYGIRVGDRWFTYNRLDPIGLNIGIAADIAELAAVANEEDADKLVLVGAGAFMQGLNNKTWFANVSEFIEMMNDPVRNFDNFVKKFASSFVPFSSLVRNIKGTADPVWRDTRESLASVGDGLTGQDNTDFIPDPISLFAQEFINEVRARTPGFSESLPARRNLWGEKIDSASGLGWAYDFLSPVYSTAHEPDAVDQLFLANRIDIGLPTRRAFGVQLTPEEYERFVEMAGVPAKEELNNLLDSGAFDELTAGPEGSAAELAKKVVRQNRKTARAQLLIEFPEFAKRLQLQKEKDQLRKIQGNSALQAVEELLIQ